MRSLILFAAVVSFAAARRAEAEGAVPLGPEIAFVAGVVVVGMVDVGFGSYDWTTRRASKEVAFVELLVTAPQVGLGIYLMADHDDWPVSGVVAVSLVSVLVGHGVYVLIRPEPKEEEEEDARIFFAPTVVSDGREVGPGLGVGGYF